ncbi:MAG: phosphatase PAP2 family protein, partial [Candidatus Hodarchaeales archaeon]
KNMSDFILGPLGESLIRLIQDLSNPIFDLYFGVVTTLGNSLPIIIVFALLYYTFDKDFIIRMIYLLIFSVSFNHIAKIFFHNPRPYIYDSEFQVTTDVLGKQTPWGEEFYSFPSGHAQTQGTIWGYLFPKTRNISLFIFGSILLISIPLSRSYLGVHWPSDIIIGALFGIGISIMYMKLETQYGIQIGEWSDKKKISAGILASFGLVMIGLISFFMGTIFPFNDPISLNDPSVWINMDIGTYPGLLAGIVIGRVLEKKHVNFNTDERNKKKTSLRVIIGIISVVVLYLGAKVIDKIAEAVQNDIPWITQVTNYASYFVIAIFIAFCIPWLFDKIEKRLNFT